MKITAILSCRNEAPYLKNCLDYITGLGIEFCLVDNESSDESMDIVHSDRFRSFFKAYESVPYYGYMDLESLIRAKVQLMDRISSGWILNISPDEILHPNLKGETLLSVAQHFDKEGFTVINFDEFVFLPLEYDYQPAICDWQPMKSYYFFQPSHPRLMRLWKHGVGLDPLRFAEHRLHGQMLRLAPESLVLRHYMFRDQEHAYQKYTQRAFKKEALERGWHRNRHNIAADRFTLPRLEAVQKLNRSDQFRFDRSHPRKKHYWFWEGSVSNAKQNLGTPE